jgi:hypothetical protein
MDLELRFEALAEDLLDAVVDIGVDDLAMAGAPPDPFRATAGRFAVSAHEPCVRLRVDLSGAAAGYEPGLVVHVRGRTADGRLVEFFNTAATALPRTGAGPVRVALSRIR